MKLLLNGIIEFIEKAIKFQEKRINPLAVRWIIDLEADLTT